MLLKLSQAKVAPSQSESLGTSTSWTTTLTNYVDMTYIFILQHELIILQGASGQTIQTVTFLAFHIAPINYCIAECSSLGHS